MKEKIRLQGKFGIIKERETLEEWLKNNACIELTPSDLISQLREQGWTLDNNWNPPKQECEHEANYHLVCFHCGKLVDDKYYKSKPAEKVEDYWIKTLEGIQFGDTTITSYEHNHLQQVASFLKRLREPAQKPKIEEIHYGSPEEIKIALKRLADKINELVRAVNGLYERER